MHVIGIHLRSSRNEFIALNYWAMLQYPTNFPFFLPHSSFFNLFFFLFFFLLFRHNFAIWTHLRQRWYYSCPNFSLWNAALFLFLVLILYNHIYWIKIFKISLLSLMYKFCIYKFKVMIYNKFNDKCNLF